MENPTSQPAPVSVTMTPTDLKLEFSKEVYNPTTGFYQPSRPIGFPHWNRVVREWNAMIAIRGNPPKDDPSKQKYENDQICSEWFRKLTREQQQASAIASKCVAELNFRENHWKELAATIGDNLALASLGGLTADTDEQRAVVKAVHTYAKNLVVEITTGTNIVAFGPVGVGKDYLLAALAHEAAEQFGVRFSWQYGPSMFRELRASLDDEEKWVKRLVDADVLILSDPLPPVGPLTQFQATSLSDVIDQRNRQHKPIWASINVTSGQEADERMGSPLVDRLKAGAYVLPMFWASYRKPKFVASVDAKG